MNDTSDKDKLLGQLRIDRSEEAPQAGKGWIAAGVAVLVIMAGAAWWWSRASATFEVQIATAAAPAAQGPGAAAVLQATGYVTARRQATVSAQITGKLTEVLIEEGEHVEAGQVLAQLESRSQRAQRAEADAQLGEARARVRQFESELAQARRDYTRQQDLVTRKLVSAQAVEAARTQVDSLTAQLAAQQEAVQLAQAQLRSAQVQLDYTTVRAPFAGVVIAKAAQVGEIVSPLSAGGGFTRTGIGTLVDMDSLEVEVDVNEAYINRVMPGGPAEAVLDAYQDWTIPAHVIAIIPTADRGKATVKVRIGLDQKDPRILPDMGVRVSFLAKQAPEGARPPAPGVLVPATAIVQRGDTNVVFVVESDRARAQVVKPGQPFGDLTLVDGLEAGVRVVRAPAQEMTDGARIREGGE
ncbi:MAG TPA: efflux RND transporter periplasmic adaptor subunit [Steroidobacteraceae bacterium]|nr:efflux RND transporter periplasmic adaptor subunit [Steroidobacteraceae bacterium]